MKQVLKQAAVPRRVRGTLTIKSDDDMEFRAERKTGLSSQQVVKKLGDSKVYDTTGERKPKRIAHLVIDKESQDPVQDFFDQLEELTKEMNFFRHESPMTRPRYLMNEPNLCITAARKEHRVQCTLTIDVNKTPNYNCELMTLMQRISQCFAINQTLLNQLR